MPLDEASPTGLTPAPSPTGAPLPARDPDRVADNLQWVTEPALAYLDLQDLLDEMLSRVTRILGTDTSAILLLEDDGETLAARAAKGLEEEVQRGFRLPVGHGFAGRVAATLEPVAIEDVDTDPIRPVNPIFREKGVRSLLGAPLIVEGRLIGVIHVGTLVRRRFDHDDVHLLQTVADRVALSIDHRRLADQNRTAQALQRSLLPRSLPSLPGFQLAARYLPAGRGATVGGDWYDLIDLGGTRIGLTIGDVAGHGLYAATVMGEVRSALRAYALEGGGPSDVVNRVSRFVAGTRAPMTTLVYATMDLQSETIRYTRAGHPYPLLVRADGVSYLDGIGGPPLATSTQASYEEEEIRLHPGEVLLLYTDGLVERRGRRLTHQEATLAEIMQETSADVEDTCTRVVQRMSEGEELEDDIALLLVRNDGLGDSISFPIRRGAHELARVRGVIRRWMGATEADENEIAAVALAVSEACANAIEHAHGPRGGSITVEATRKEGEVTIAVSDEGRWREPGTSGGRGIPLMKEFMDEVDVAADPGGTTIRLRRRLRRSQR